MPGIAAFLNLMDIETIIIDRESRQRTEIDDLGGLIADISQRGLLNPIIVSRKSKKLIAGERRLTSYKTLAAGWAGDPAANPWKRIPFRYYDELNEHDAKVVELSENLHRKELPWRDMAISVYHIHNLRTEVDEDHTQAKTAIELGMSDTMVSTLISVGEALIEGKFDFNGCASAQAAHNIIKRAQERENDAMLASLTHAMKAAPAAPAPAPRIDRLPPTPLENAINATSRTDIAPVIGEVRVENSSGTISLPDGLIESVPYTPEVEILTGGDDASRAIQLANFMEWAPTYTDEPFNLLHIDFPYGINFGAARRQNSASDRKAYDDSPDLFWELCRCLRDNLDNVVAESAHIMFWFSLGLEPDNENSSYERIIRFFSAPRKDGGCGLSVNPFPLVWCRNGSILPDPNRGPRRGYETAFLMTRGDRKIVRPVQNFFEDSARGEKSTHTSEKPQEMLKYFLGMLVDGSSRVLDPTAGSGSAIRAAKSLGANHYLGLEINPEFVELARGKLRSDEVSSSLLGDLGAI